MYFWVSSKSFSNTRSNSLQPSGSAGTCFISSSGRDTLPARICSRKVSGPRKKPWASCSISRALNFFPLVANTELDVFKAYRAFDDFEGIPLHGTYLIDENGLIRWQDVSYEPFMNPEFLLKESKRLLAQDVSVAGQKEEE